MKKMAENDTNLSSEKEEGTVTPDSFKNEDPSMNAKTYLKERLDAQLEWYDRKSSYNQKMYKKMKRFEIILAASIPVVISLSMMEWVGDTVIWYKTIEVATEHGIVTGKQPAFTLSVFLQICTAAAGVILVVVNKMFELEDYFKNWKEYRTTAEELQEERIKYMTRVEPYHEDDSVAFRQLVQSVEAILNKQNQSWKDRTPVKTDDLMAKAQEALDKQAARIEEEANQRASNRGSNVIVSSTPKPKANINSAPAPKVEQKPAPKQEDSVPQLEAPAPMDEGEEPEGEDISPIFDEDKEVG